MSDDTPAPRASPPLKRMTPRLLFEVALISLTTQHKRIQGRLGQAEARELANNIERLNVYHELTWPSSPDDQPIPG